MAGFDEKCVGMTAYMGTQDGFPGILKLRYQDFQVNEIENNGTVLHLTCQTFQSATENEKEQSTAVNIMESEFSTTLSDKDNNALKRLQDCKITNPEAIFIEVGNDKSKRRSIHNAIRQLYPQLESETIADPVTKKVNIKVTKVQHGQQKRRRTFENKDAWNLFVLYKENIATMDAINLITKKLHFKNPKVFQFAGTKDKRGITVQNVSTSLPVQRILSINKSCKNICIGNFKTSKKPLQLGDLWGNHFSIVLRDIKTTDETIIENAVSSWIDFGFINYYGMQRFGCREIPTYEIGKALLAKNWSKAVDIILSGLIEGEDSLVQKYAQKWKEGIDAANVYKKLRRKASPEGYLIKGIIKHGTKQLVQALGNIPRNTRLLYLHSYQSYVWNRVASKRIMVYGKKPVVGDLIMLNAAHIEHSNDTSSSSAKRLKLCEDLTNVKKNDHCDQLQSNLKCLTEEDLASHSISDVILPLPGESITYPCNDVQKWYEEIIAEDGLDMSMLQHTVKEYRLSGAYRKLISHPTAVNWDIVRYDDYKKPLLLSDRDRLEGITELCLPQDGEYRAIRIHFNLPSSSYATVALRELLKSDMSVKNQSLIGDDHKLQSAGDRAD